MRAGGDLSAQALCLAMLSAWASDACAATPDPANCESETCRVVVSPLTVFAPRREAGEIVGDEPISLLGSADIAGFGAGDIGELLNGLALEIRGADGSPPVLLLNGARISSVSQLRDLPTEALQRVEIHSGDAAVRLGYGAQQRVVNFVLRSSYRDFAIEGGAGLATDGGGVSEQARLGLDRIRSGQRLSLTGTYEHSDWLLESERPVVDGFGAFRTLAPATDRAVLHGVYAHTIGGVSASLDASLGETWDTSRLGPRIGDVLLDGPPIGRDQSSTNAHIGLTLSGALNGWTWSLVGNASHNHSRTLTDRDAVGANLRDLTRSTRDQADADLLLFGPVAKLPAGEITASVDLGVDGEREDDLDRGSGGEVRSTVGYGHRKVEAGLTVPLVGNSGPLAPIGSLAASFSYERDWFSDFHGLDNSGLSLIWRPSPSLSLVVTHNHRASAPSIDQLGAPLLATPNVPVFDFVRGETTNVTLIDGGFPGLAPERDTTTSVSMQLRPIAGQQFTLSFNFTDARRRGTIGSPSVVSTAFEQAFPARFVRDAAGRLITIDTRPINFAAGEEQQIRWGFNLVESLGRADKGQRPQLRLSAYHTWRLEDRLQLAPGAAELDFLRGDAGPGATGKPRHEIEASADLSRGGVGAELTGAWKGASRINGSGPLDPLVVSPLLLLNAKLHASGRADGPPILRGALFTLSVDNLLGQRPRVRDASGATPIAYQPDYLDPLGRAVRLSVRKLF